MFTGLIEATGTVVSLAAPAGIASPLRLTVSAPALAGRLRAGDSIAVSGVCLTALDLTLTQFSADLAEETVQRTTLARFAPGTVVNLELPTPAGAPLGGHVVQGHVDGVATLLSFDPIHSAGGAAEEAASDWRLRFVIPSNLARYVVAQGSIAVEGISLTVADILGDVVSIAVIPHTYAVTSLRTLRAGSSINVEVDVLGKYAERQAVRSAATEVVPNREPAPGTSQHWTLSNTYLLANGY